MKQSVLKGLGDPMSNDPSARAAGNRAKGWVFWLPGLLLTGLPEAFASVACSAFVPGYSGGTAPESHRSSPPKRIIKLWRP